MEQCTHKTSVRNRSARFTPLLTSTRLSASGGVVLSRSANVGLILGHRVRRWPSTASSSYFAVVSNYT